MLLPLCQLTHLLLLALLIKAVQLAFNDRIPIQFAQFFVEVVELLAADKVHGDSQDEEHV